MLSLKFPTAILALWVAAGCRPTAPTKTTEELVGRPSAQSEALRGNLWYHLDLGDDHLDAALRLFQPPQRTKFFLPGTWAGRTDFAHSIGITGASTNAGAVDVAINRSAGELEVQTTDAEWVQLQYRVELGGRSDFHAQLDNGVLVGFGPTFLVTPAQQVLERTTQIPIELRVPLNYDVISTWPSLGHSQSAQDPTRAVHKFLAADVGELRDAFVVAGPTLRTIQNDKGERLIEVAFSPAFEGDTTGFAKLITDVTNRFRTRFGNAGPVHVFVRTRTSSPTEFGGVGRRGGFILDVAPDTAVSEATRLLIAHEALHVWNGHLLEPTPAVEVSTRWFKEGVTHYLALKSLPNLSERFVLEELATIAANYQRNPLTRGQRGRPVDEARLPYDFGFLVALAMDATLAHAPNARGDLNCWLSTLLSGDDTSYDEQTLLAAIQECAGSPGDHEVATVWRRFVRSRESLDLAPLFGGVGLHWLPERAQQPARLVALAGPAPLYRELFSLPPLDQP